MPKCQDSIHRRPEPAAPRLIAAQRAGDDVAELLPRVVKPGEVGLQRRDLAARRVPERRDQQVLAGPEVILQGADRHAALRGHVREPGGVGAPLGDHPAGRLEHRHLAPPGPPLAAAGRAGAAARQARPARGAGLRRLISGHHAGSSIRAGTGATVGRAGGRSPPRRRPPAAAAASPW